MAHFTENSSLHKQNAFQKYFLSKLNDPRRTSKGNLIYKFGDILFLAISSAICGITDWDSIEIFGKSQLEWLKKYGDFSNGIPSHDTINRVISSLDPKMFSNSFTEWINEISNVCKGEVVPIDGKTIKGSSAKCRSENPIHIVSAYASDNNLCLGQVKVDQKSNEITAIPKLLDLIAVKGCTITIDAMGCQTAIAEKIIEKEAQYILAVKGNQGNLEQGIQDTIRFSKPFASDIEDDFGHGRIEKRSCFVYDDLSHIEGKEKWVEFSAIVHIKSEVYDKSTDENYCENRFYITSLPAGEAKYINRAVRSHWSIENKLHWNLDVVFGEDAARKRARNAAENMNVIQKMALALIQRETTLKKSKKNKMLMASLSHEYREKVLVL